MTSKLVNNLIFSDEVRTEREFRLRTRTAELIADCKVQDEESWTVGVFPDSSGEQKVHARGPFGELESIQFLDDRVARLPDFQGHSHGRPLTLRSATVIYLSSVRALCQPQKCPVTRRRCSC